ncbi:MAG: hypothetical protein MZW92_18210 [Comamonadaceae bacterium]|nr:hypothetical protein [Comamonadaceae bacterium]
MDYSTGASAADRRHSRSGRRLHLAATTRRSKTELVIFLRPIVVSDASIAGDFRGYRATTAGRTTSSTTPGARAAGLTRRSRSPAR